MLNTHFKKPLAAARKLFETNYSNRDQEKFKGGAGFELTGAIHDGNSANLAIASLWYAGLLKSTGQRERFEIHPKVVITGDIDEEEIVLPVEKESIRLKVKAAFFSWCNMLVVPYSQRKYFEDELDKLSVKYPTRRLDLIGVNQLREIFFDRRLSDHEVQNRAKYYFNMAKSQKYRIVTVPLIAILIAIIGRLILGPIDQNPVTAEFEGEHMILKNQYGQTIRSIEVGSMVLHDLQASKSTISRSKAGFFDLNDDGINEVFFARNLNTQEQTKEEELLAYSASGDSLIWTKMLRFDLQFSNKPSIGEDPYRVFNVSFFTHPRGKTIWF